MLAPIGSVVWILDSYIHGSTALVLNMDTEHGPISYTSSLITKKPFLDIILVPMT